MYQFFNPFTAILRRVNYRRRQKLRNYRLKALSFGSDGFAIDDSYFFIDAVYPVKSFENRVRAVSI